MIEKPTKSSDLQSKAREEHLNGNSSKAILLLTEAIQQDSSNLDVAMDMVQVFLDIGELEQAISLFSKFPDTIVETSMGNSLNTQINLKILASKTEGKDSLRERIFTEPENMQAKFDLAICYFSEHNIESGMDQLFVIMEKDSEFKEGAAKEMIITVANMLEQTDIELSKSYRNKLANLTN